MAKYYWLKLNNDFFKRHDIRIIEEMPNGKDYVLFYLKLMLESVNHEGTLRFSDTIPYNEQMLSVITNTNVDIVRSAMELLKGLGLLEVLDDDTLYMKEVEKLIGLSKQDDKTRENTRLRVQKHRERQKMLPENTTEKGVERYSNVTCNGEIDIDIDIDIDKKEKYIKRKKFEPPTLQEVKDYINEKGYQVDADQFFEYYTAGDWKDAKGNQVKNWKQKVITWNKRNGTDTSTRRTESNSAKAGSDYARQLFGD